MIKPLARSIALRVIQALALKAENHVLQHRAPRHQAGILEHHAAVDAGAGHRFAVDRNMPRRRFEQTIAQIDEGGFAATAGSDDGNEFAFVHFEVDLVQGQEPAASSRLIVLMP